VIKSTGMNEAIYTELEKGSFKIVSSREGLEFSGFSPVIDTESQLEAFAKVVSAAWQDRLAIQRELKSRLHDLH